MKQLWMIVGGNGAGKTTFYNRFLAPKKMPFINADIIAKEVYPDSAEASSLKAAKLAESIRMAKLREGVNFCFETVFSHPSKIDFLAQAKAMGYRTHLIFIHINTPELNVARVSQRVIEGGHTVPTDKIYSRIPRTLDNVRRAKPLCDSFWVFDNSDVSDAFNEILIIEDGVIKLSHSPLPEWAKNLLS